MSSPFDNAFDLRRAIVAISERQGSQLRSTIDQFLRHVSPGMLTSHADFPVTVRRHPVDPERCISWLSRDQMLCFHVGNTILGYYETVRPRVGEGQKSVAVFRKRLHLLEQIAGLGLDEFIVVGTDSIGYTLRLKDDERRDLEEKQRAEAEEPNAVSNAPKAKAR